MKRLAQHGNWNADLEQRARSAMELRFAEVDAGDSDTFDYALCQRPDSSFYGIADGKRCIKGRGPITRDDALKQLAKSGVPRGILKKVAQIEDKKRFDKTIEALSLAPKKRASEPAVKPAAKTPAKSPTPEVKKAPKDDTDAAAKQKAALKLLDSAEKRVKADLEKAREDYRRTNDDEADDRIYEARASLRRLAADRKAIQAGILSEPEPKQLNEGQRRRIEAKINTIAEKSRNNTATDAERALYRRLLDMKNAKDPLEMARALKERTEISKELEALKAKTRKLELEGREIPKELKQKRSELDARYAATDDRIAFAKITRKERFGKYIMSGGALKILDTDSDTKQNNAHKNSNSIFSEHGVLGTSKQARALISKYGGNREAVQQGIDDIIDFTRNDYRAIRRAVEERSDSPRVQQAQRINQMLQRMDHPDVTKFRGMNVPESTLDQMISSARSGGTFSDPAPASWSTSGKISMEYTGKAGNDRARVLFETKNKTGASVENFGQSGEKELLTPGGTNYRYVNYRVETYEGSPVYVFSVEEL